jgi:hypothetical protein
MEYKSEKAIEDVMEKAIQEVLDSNKLWYPHNMAFACRSALVNAGFTMTKATGKPEFTDTEP